MGLRGKVAAFIAVVLSVVTLVTLLLLRSNLQEAFLSVERQQANDQMAQLGRNLGSELERLRQTTYDWASWDDVGTFLDKPNKDFVDHQATPQALKTIDIKLLVLLDLKLQPALVEAVNIMNGQPENGASYDTVLEHVRERLASAPAGADSDCGLDNSPAGALLLCWQPVKRSAQNVSSPGMIVMGRLLNSAMVSKIQKQGNIHFDLISLPLDAAHAPLNAVAAPAPGFEPQQVAFSKTEAGVINGVLMNIVGQPIQTVRLQFPTDISQRGGEFAWRALAIIVTTTVLSALVLFAGIQSMLIARLRKMGNDLNSIWRNGRWAGRLHSVDDNDDINELAHAINRLLGLIRKQTMVLETMAVTDSLTRIGNRRAFDERIVIEMSLHKRNQTALALMIIHVDQLKEFNDQFGHPAGDEILVEIGKLLTQVACRPADLPVRLAEERFAIILPATELAGASHVAQLLKGKFAGIYLPQSTTRIAEHVSLRIGITCAGAEDLETFVQRAELAAQQASQGDPDQVVSLPVPG